MIFYLARMACMTFVGLKEQSERGDRELGGVGGTILKMDYRK